MREILRLGTAMIEILWGFGDPRRPSWRPYSGYALGWPGVDAPNRERYRVGKRQDARCAIIGMRALTAPAIASSRPLGLSGLRTRGLGRDTASSRASRRVRSAALLWK